MALQTNRKRYIKVIDGTIPEIFSLSTKVSRLDIVAFCWSLKEIGVNMIEVDRYILKRLGKLPSGIDFLYRLNSARDIDLIVKSSIKHCITAEKVWTNPGVLEEVLSGNLCPVLEVGIHNTGDFAKINRMEKAGLFERVGGIRVTGLARFDVLQLKSVYNSLKRYENINIDICPENTNFTATAAAVEALMCGFDTITGTFTGFGGNSGYAATEEFLMAAKVLLNSDIKPGMSVLPDLYSRFTRVTGIKIPDIKPVIGSSIFRYESGIHADGIEKNPITYEPYDPSLVGQERKLSIGKHSGRKAIEKKLKDMGVLYRSEEITGVLDSVRELSMKLKRNLYDEDLRRLFEVSYENC